MNKYLDDYGGVFESVNIGFNTSSLHNRFLNLGFFSVSDGMEMLNETGINILNEVVKYISENKNFVLSKNEISYLGLYDGCLRSFENNSYGNDFKIIPDSTVKLSDDTKVSEIFDSTGFSDPEIALLEKYGLVEKVNGEIVLTESGADNDIFRIMCGSKLFNSDVVENSERESSESGLIDESVDVPYFTIAERTDDFEGYSIFFDDVEIPLVMQKESILNCKCYNVVSPQMYILSIINEAYKNDISLNEQDLSSILIKHLHKSAKYGISFLTNEYDKLFRFDEDLIYPGVCADKLLEVVYGFLNDGYGSIQKPENLNFAFMMFNDIENDLEQLKVTQSKKSSLKNKSSAKIEIIGDDGISVLMYGHNGDIDRRQLIQLSDGSFTALGDRLFSEKSLSVGGGICDLGTWLYKWGLSSDGKLNDEGKNLFNLLGVSCDIIDG
ncbi:MAG: hypothetical protein GQ477_01315 [Nanohaloarchaea archaeon]|nr:hypothetical protein [Candidatus Nanohaloarchaea archaeon]